MPAFAQDTAAASADAIHQDEEIVVRADGDQVRIDRRIYAVRNDPIAQATDMFDVLGRIPAVSIDPSGSVSLLGAGGPEIQINGQPLPMGASVEQILRGIPGANVERIEVITNPSAQYSSATARGIINIVLRQRFKEGLSGNVGAGADSFGGLQTSLAPSWSHGAWTLASRLGYYASPSDSGFHRVRTDFASGDVTKDDGRDKRTFHGNDASLQATYQHDTKNRGTLSFTDFDGQADSAQDLATLSDGAPSATEDQNQGQTYRFNAVDLALQHDGDRPTEQLRFDLTVSHNQFGDDDRIALTPAMGVPPSPFITRNATAADGSKATLDYDLPLSGQSVVTTGLSAESRTQHISDLLRPLVGPPGPNDFSSTLTGREQTLAAYATYQFGWGNWLFQPGLRGENYRREVTSAGVTTDTTDFRAFPTIHIRRSLRHIDVDLSYTSRIDRPDVSSLDPAVRFLDATHAISGNPNLKPSRADAYEANFTYQEHEQSFSVTLFDRLSHSVASSFVEQNGDVTLVTEINAGDTENRGVEAILRGSFSPHWRYALNANALGSTFNVLRNNAFVQDSGFEYGGAALLEYRDTDQNAVGADDVQLDLRFQGPQHMLQQQVDPSYSLNLSWRRRISHNFFGFLQVSDILGSRNFRSTTKTDDFLERSSSESPGVRLRLSLTYQFGNATERPPAPPPSDNAGPAPMR
jgi:outer membrane receptor protein involved in Fe transport